MSEYTEIPWTDATWNPVRGCTKVSPGCLHCYAETFAERFRGVPGHPFEQGFDLRIVPEKLEEPLKWKKPRKIFVNSMSDMFHDGVSDDYILKVCDVMMRANWHTYQVLTKRADRLREFLLGWKPAAANAQHVWWGVSVENRKHGIPRVDKLRDANPKVAFLSIEPLLEDLGTLDLRGISWVIIGGESGSLARPCNIEWIRSIKDQCTAAKTACFVKQFGSRIVIDIQDARGHYMGCEGVEFKHPKGGNMDEWPEDLRVRQWPESRR